MVKKTKKKISKKKTRTKKANSPETHIETKLIENFVSLQKVMVNLSIKFDGLTNQISKLLELFEISAKTLTEKEINFGIENKENKKIAERLDSLLDQNKTIARGLTLIHEHKINPSEKTPEIKSSINKTDITNPKLPEFP